MDGSSPAFHMQHGSPSSSPFVFPSPSLSAAQSSAEDSGSTSNQIDAQTQDTGAVTADSGSMSPIDGGETQPSDSGTSEADDAGFAMDAQSPSDSGVLADAMASNFTCPPSGPYGSNTGDTSPNIELQDCDGNTVRLHDFCNRKATWMFSLPLW